MIRFKDYKAYQKPQIREYIPRPRKVLCLSPSNISGWKRTGDDNENEGEEW